MRDGNASMYLGSPRMAEMVIGEKVTLEEMGGARMHTSKSGCGDVLVESDEEGIEFARRYLGYFRRPATAQPGAGPDQAALRDLIPVNRKRVYDVRAVIATLFDADSVL